MTTFIDLLRAKVAIQLRLLTPEQAQASLKAVDGGRATLDVLRQDFGVDETTASRIERHAIKCERLKSESVYLRLLRQHGAVPEATLTPILFEVRQAENGQSLGETLVARGLIDLGLHQQLANQTRGHVDRDNAQIAARYRERGYDGIERSSQTVVSVINEEEQKARAPTARGQAVAEQTGTGTGGGGQVDAGSATGEEELTRDLPAPPSTLPPELARSGLDQKYQIVRKCGEGGMGAVYLAYAKDDAERETPLALKVVLDIAKSKDAAARFKREILATSFCAHENIIEIHDAAETDDGSYYMAMEYLEGDELADIIKHEGPIALPRLVRLLDQVLQGLVAIHDANIVHRDIKPQNFRITKRPDGSELLKIVDFGIARVLDAEDSGAGDQFFKTMGGKITGSPAYIAPESITEPQVDARADLYSLGISIFRIAAGRLPFAAKEPTEYLPMHLYKKPPKLREMIPHAPEALEEFVDRLLKKVPDDRFADTHECLAFFRQMVWPAVLPGEPIPGSGASGGAVAAPALDLPPAPELPPTLAPSPPLSPLAPPPPLAPLPPLPGELTAAERGAALDPQQHLLDNLGFTAPDMVAPTQEELDRAEHDAQPALEPAAAPAAEEEPQLGFFARIWAALFGKKKQV
ncbi:MAG: serine/threonine-protein kinase [Planctomycetota bacterium]